MTPYVEPRPQTDPAERVVLALVYAIRDQFYRDEQKARFYPELKELKRVITWPAKWMNDKAIYVTPERYQTLIMNLLLEIKRHGDTGAIGYWPRYLLKCVQDHFLHNGEQYYEEGKAVRELATRVLAKLPAPAAAIPADQFTRDLATVHALLRSPGGRKSTTKAAPAAVQQNLL